jgi:hypothetical protein
VRRDRKQQVVEILVQERQLGDTRGPAAVVRMCASSIASRVSCQLISFQMKLKGDLIAFIISANKS